jgi:hypothetical protein
MTLALINYWLSVRTAGVNTTRRWAVVAAAAATTAGAAIAGVIVLSLIGFRK